MKRFFLFFAISGILTILAPLQASALMIDNFIATSDPAGYWQLEPSATPVDTANSLSLLETDLDGVLGGSRFFTVTTHPRWVSYSGYTGWVNGNLDGVLFSGSYSGRTGFMFLNSAWGGWGSINVLYDAGGAGLEADFSGGTAITIAFDPDHVGNGRPSVLSVELRDGSGAYARVARTWTTYDTSLDWTDVNFMLSDFTGVDLTDIFSVSWTYEADYASDVAFDYVSVDASVPLPGAVWLLGSGLLGLAGIRRKHHKDKS